MSNSLDRICTVDISLASPISNDANFDNILILGPAPANPTEDVPAVGVYNSLEELTALGIIAGNLLPLRAVSALSVALYGMFLAIIIPPARKDKIVAALVAISFALSFACTYLPGISALSDGTRTILLTVAISCAAAILFPVKQEEGNQ